MQQFKQHNYQTDYQSLSSSHFDLYELYEWTPDLLAISCHIKNRIISFRSSAIDTMSCHLMVRLLLLKKKSVKDAHLQLALVLFQARNPVWHWGWLGTFGHPMPSFLIIEPKGTASRLQPFLGESWLLAQLWNGVVTHHQKRLQNVTIKAMKRSNSQSHWHWPVESGSWQMCPVQLYGTCVFILMLIDGQRQSWFESVLTYLKQP